MNTLSSAGLVFLGGALGTLARFGVDAALGERYGIPFGILVINIAGAFLLGLLIEGLAPDGGDEWRSTRLFLGTGVLGGFTTYSALSAGVAGLVLADRIGLAALYGALTLLLGGLASWLGILAARAVRRRAAES